MAKRPQKKRPSPKPGPVRETAAAKPLPRKPELINWKIILQALVIAAAVLWIYSHALHGGWLWDDDLDITDNTITQSSTGLWKIWFAPGSLNDYYPIKASVQWLQWHLWGMDTLGYHLTNVLLHILSALLVWRLFSKFGLRLAWLGGLIFAIHPVQVESVAWIAELKNTLSLPPFLLAMCAWIDFEKDGKRRDYWLSLGLFLVAMLCKTTMVMFPVVILLYAWWKRNRIGWNDLKMSVPFFIVSVALGLLTAWLQYHKIMEQMDNPLGGIFSRLVGAGLSLSFYFSKCFLPVDLMPIYPQWAIDPHVLWQFLPWLMLGAAIYWFWTKREDWGRHALLGLGFFLIFLGLFLGFNAISYMKFTWVMDHFLYLPIIGLIGLFVAALGQVEKQMPTPFRFCGIGLVTTMLALLALESRGYAKMFVDSETLWTYELHYNPNAYPAWYNLGHAKYQKGQLSEAIEPYEQALQIKPDYADAHNNLGNAMLHLHRLPEALAQFEQALQINPDYADAHYNLGDALQQAGRTPEAIEQYRQVLRISPDDAQARNNLGELLLQTGQPQEAMEQLEQALQIKPDYADAHYNLANAQFQTGHRPEAMDQYQQALRIKPNYAEARNNLGLVLFQTGRIPEAIEQYDAVLQIKPDYAEAHYNLANALLQTGQASQAAEQYQQALRIKPDYAEAHNNLGAALFQMGQRSPAIEEFNQALRIDPNLASARDNLTRAQALQNKPPTNN